jgi:anti-sigma factor RsiW
MTEQQHFTGPEIQAYLDAGTGDRERLAMDAHLSACVSCQAEVAEWRSLFTELSAVPQFDPSIGFADRVLAGLQTAHAAAGAGAAAGAALPWHTRATRLAARVIPRSTRGWALAAAFLALPLISAAAFVAWLTSHAYVTPSTLIAFAADRSAHALEGLGSGAVAWAMKTDAVAWAVRLSGELVHRVGMSGIGTLLACIAIAITISSWVLYNNLFRSPSREVSHVSFSF